MLFRTIYARQCPVPARDLRSQLKHGLKCLYMNKMDILNNYCGTLICGYLFNFSLKLKKKKSCARDTTNCYIIFTAAKVSIPHRSK